MRAGIVGVPPIMGLYTIVPPLIAFSSSHKTPRWREMDSNRVLETHWRFDVLYASIPLATGVPNG